LGGGGEERMKDENWMDEEGRGVYVRGEVDKWMY